MGATSTLQTINMLISNRHRLLREFIRTSVGPRNRAEDLTDISSSEFSSKWLNVHGEVAPLTCGNGVAVEDIDKAIIVLFFKICTYSQANVSTQSNACVNYTQFIPEIGVTKFYRIRRKYRITREETPSILL